MVRYDVAYTVAVWFELFALFNVEKKVVNTRGRSFENGMCFFPERGIQADTVTGIPDRHLVDVHSCYVSFMYVRLLYYFGSRLSSAIPVVQLYRYMRAFILDVDPRGYLFYMRNLKRWDSQAVNVSMVLTTWLSDGLVIYRCYLIWNCNFWVVLVPILLLLFAIGLNTTTLAWFQHPALITRSTGWALMNLIYPIALLRNVITTGLIVLKIWRQHRSSAAAGLIDHGSPLNLARLLRIVVESAMVYTLQLFVLLILYFLKSNVQIILQTAIVPSAGLVFVLIAVRVHTIQEQSTTGTPAWLGNSDSEHELHERVSSPERALAFVVDVEKFGGAVEVDSFSKPELEDANYAGGTS
ncbi:hypothetical protein CVT26_015173 [Gymnopilus dilepis]|uniref:Uncharacterized protein n=1 Tax=Gymnopilus dilepis TaxID=231916 RepID=A0A409WA05_9AGAR|nr:hypothetical protein CVT26_015173 [Gymnopilus dilepis]